MTSIFSELLSLYMQATSSIDNETDKLIQVSLRKITLLKTNKFLLSRRQNPSLDFPASSPSAFQCCQILLEVPLCLTGDSEDCVCKMHRLDSSPQTAHNRRLRSDPGTGCRQHQGIRLTDPTPQGGSHILLKQLKGQTNVM